MAVPNTVNNELWGWFLSIFVSIIKKYSNSEHFTISLSLITLITLINWSQTVNVEITHHISKTFHLR